MTTGKTYEVRIFDGNPNETAGLVWPTTFTISGIDELQDVLNEANDDAAACPDYEDGDTLWYDVHDLDGDVWVKSGTFRVSK